MTVELTHVKPMGLDRSQSLHDAPKGTSWSDSRNVAPLDLGGPADVPFERFADEWIEMPLMKRFEQVALRYADRIAVDDGKIRLTYRALRYAVYRLAKRLEAIPSNGKPIGIFLPHDARFPLAALTCFALGRIFVPIDVKHPAARILEIMAEAGLDTVILDASAENAVMLPQVLTRIDIGAAFNAGSEASKPNKPKISVIAPATVLYTSGSTGKPKGICNSQRGILQRVAATVNTYHLHAEDRVILLSSLGTVAGMREAFSTLLSGAALYVADPRRHGIGGVLNLLHEARITICYTVPPLLRTLLQANEAQQAFSHLRIMRISGDVALDGDLELCRRILPSSCHILISFSSTEMPNAFQWFVPRDWKGNGTRVPIGYPQPGVNFMIVDENDEPVAPGEIGELIVRSRYTAIGQWQYGDLQPGPFLPDPYDPSLLVQRTGDLMKQREDGLWELVGRKDRQIKIRGQRVDPGEVEAVLRDCDVSDAAVIARRNDAEIIALVAYVVPRTPAKPDLIDDIRQTLARRLPQHMRPTEIRLLEAIPLLPGFKPDIIALEKIDRAELEGTVAVEPADSGIRSELIREAVKHAWTSVLGAKSYQAGTRWDETGGDSLKAMQMWFRIEQKLGCKISIDVLQDDTTPHKLAADIERYLHKPVKDAANDSHTDATPVLFLMPGILGDEPLLSHFRAAFNWNMRFKVIEYPEWRGAKDAHAGFDAIVDAAFRQICAEPDCTSYALAGYSFGGYVAFETARRLAASGRRVDFLGLIDSRMHGMTSAMGYSCSQSRRAQLKRYASMLIDPAAVIRILFKRSVALGRYAAWAITSRPSTAISFTFYRDRNYEQRVNALRRWKFTPLDLPITLFLSDQGLSDLPADYGWGKLCKRLSAVHVGGTHTSILESPRREILCRHFLEVLGPAAKSVVS